MRSTSVSSSVLARVFLVKRICWFGLGSSTIIASQNNKIDGMSRYFLHNVAAKESNGDEMEISFWSLSIWSQSSAPNRTNWTQLNVNNDNKSSEIEMGHGISMKGKPLLLLLLNSWHFVCQRKILRLGS